jgi:hypothetical protein
MSLSVSVVVLYRDDVTRARLCGSATLRENFPGHSP